MVTKESIIAMLKTNDKAVARALLALNERQTQDEKNSESTRYDNGQGFRPCHARMGTSMANFYSRFGRLSPKQIAYWRNTMKDGKMRIEIYAGQLLMIAQAKAATKATLAPKAADKCAGPTVYGMDVGNMQEEIMVLEEQIDIMTNETYNVNNFDNFGKIEALQERIAMLRKECARAYKEMNV